MALNYTLRWLCDVVPVLSDHESDRYSAWEVNDLFTGRQRSLPPRFEPFPQEVGQRLSSTASSSSILDTYHSPDMSYFALSTLPCNPPKQPDHVQYVTSPSRRGTPFSRLVSGLLYQKCEEEIDADGVGRLSNFVSLLDT